jgi:hypothetical protein
MTEENNVTELPIAAGPGRDRREHNRWRIEGAMAQTDGRDWPLVDISIGGLVLPSRLIRGRRVHHARPNPTPS